MLHEFYAHPGTKVPVKVNGHQRGYLLKLVFELSCDYPFNHKYLEPDLINAPVVITTRKGREHLIEPERLARHQSEEFRLVSVKFTKEDWDREIYYRWKKIPPEKRQEDNLALSEIL